MSEIFHKSCYTSRSCGYKYRTQATNTGDKDGRKRIIDKGESTIDKKIKEIRNEMTSRADLQVDHTQKTRQAMQEKFSKVESKISAMLALKEVIAGLQKDLHNAEESLVGLASRVSKLHEITGGDDYSLKSRKSSFRKPPIFENALD